MKSFFFFVIDNSITLWNIFTFCVHFTGEHTKLFYSCIFFWRKSPQWVRASSFTSFLDHTQRCTIVGRTPLDGWSAIRRDLYLTTHNTHNRDSHSPGGIRTHNLSKRAAADPRLRPRGHWDRHVLHFVPLFSYVLTGVVQRKTFLSAQSTQATNVRIYCSQFKSSQDLACILFLTLHVGGQKTELTGRSPLSPLRRRRAALDCSAIWEDEEEEEEEGGGGGGGEEEEDHYVFHYITLSPWSIISVNNEQVCSVYKLQRAGRIRTVLRCPIERKTRQI